MKAAKTPLLDPCNQCKKSEATRIVDVHAAVRIMARLCTRCANKILIAHPASSAVAIAHYE